MGHRASGIGHRALAVGRVASKILKKSYNLAATHLTKLWQLSPGLNILDYERNNIARNFK